MKRLLIIDGQLFQTEAWHRGMGKYSMELLDALVPLVRKQKWQGLRLVLSRNINTEQEVFDNIKRRLPEVEIVLLDLKPDEIGNSAVPTHNRRTVDEYVEESWNRERGDCCFLILSAMQGIIYPTFPTVVGVTKLLLFYDLIPLMFHDIYLRNSITRNEYLPRIGELLKADLYFAISKTVANDLAVVAGIDGSRIVSIDGGAIKHGEGEKKYIMPEPFILMPTGNDLRKNNKRAIIGFEEFNKRHGNRYTLVITSFFKDFEIAELSSLSPSVVFTGNISGDELAYLYDKASVVLFPPEYEGLGMPILEALEKHKPVACSNISVFREMSTRDFHYFDPYSTIEISKSLDDAIANPKVDQKRYATILARYTWAKSAEKLVEALDAVKPSSDSSAERLRLAVLGPDPLTDAPVGRIMLEQHAELSRRYSLSYFLEPSVYQMERRINFLPYVCDVRTNTVGCDFKCEDYDGVLYHLGNGSHFALTMLAALANPGIAVLYDTVLDEAWGALETGGLVDSGRMELERRLESLYDVQGASHLAALLSGQRMVIVFNADHERIVHKVSKACGLSVSVIRVDMPIANLVYETALPDKTQDMLTLRPGAAMTDFRELVELSKAQIRLVDGVPSAREVLETTRLGVVPCLEGLGESVGVGADLVVVAKDGDSPERVAQRLLSDPGELAKMGSQAIKRTREKHAVDNLIRIVASFTEGRLKEGDR